MRMMLFAALHRLGRAQVDEVCQFLENGNYRVRCATPNTLKEIVSVKNVGRIGAALRNALKRETTVAVRSSINSALRKLKHL